MEIIGLRHCMYGYGEYIVNTYQGNHRSLLQLLSYQEATVLGINGKTKAKTIMIGHILFKKPISANHSIELLLNLND